MTLYLLPNTLGPVADISYFLPACLHEMMAQLDGLIAESEREGRRYLSRFKTKKPTHQLPLALLPEGKGLKTSMLDFLLEPVQKGENWGLVADAGLPCLADPGAELVQRARQLSLKVEAVTGPSSITHALMLSGLPAQRFSFHGYLPKHPDQRTRSLRKLEAAGGITHLFIEAPYRNSHLWASCLSILHPKTLLCVGSCLTLPEQWIHTTSIDSWRGWSAETIGPYLMKKPVIFLIYSYASSAPSFFSY